MNRVKWSVTVFLFAVSSCSPSESDNVPLFPLLGGAPVDAELAEALARAGVTALSEPPAQDPDLVILGQALFFERELSGDRDISCSTCHHAAAATTDALSVSIGAGGTGAASNRTIGAGSMIARNAQPLFNLASAGPLFWDGRVSKGSGGLTTPEPSLNGAAPARADIAAQLTTVLAAQAMFPVTSDTEMRGEPGNEIRDASGNTAIWAAIMARLVGTNNGTAGGIAAYRTLFAQAYPEVTNFDNFNFGHAARAIAAFEIASYASSHSPLDEYLRGNVLALTPEAKAGGLLFFGRAGCGGCHNGPMLSDGGFHGIAAPQLGPGAAGGDDEGRFLESGSAQDRYHFRTPFLRNVSLTGPFTHAGAYASLGAVIAHYNDTARAVRNYNSSQVRADFAVTVDTNAARIEARIAARDQRVRRPLGLGPVERAQLLQFLESLTDPSARNLSDSVPLSVPSGLPVD